jgi:hypothetical protein
MEKLKLTTHLAGLLPPELGYTTEVAFAEWWYNPKKTGGMRLTHVAYTLFIDNLCMKGYEMDIQPGELSLKMLVDLDRKLQEPYYIDVTGKIPKKIVFFGSKEAMIAKLYGNIKLFLKNYA